MTYVIAEPGVNVMDRSCVEECPVDRVYVGDLQMDTDLVASLPPAAGTGAP